MEQQLPFCPVETTLTLIGDKWKVLIIRDLMDGTKRFGELKKTIGKVSQKVLTANLRSLEQAGLITRTVFAEVPPRVEYTLTETGYSLKPILDAMWLWGFNYKKEKGCSLNCAILGTNHNIALVQNKLVSIHDVASAFDLMQTVQEETHCRNIILPVENLSADFFQPSNGLAGEILQKYANYHVKMAIVGDFSPYQSNSLQGFFNKHNQGNQFFFVATMEDAVDKLSSLSCLDTIQ